VLEEEEDDRVPLHNGPIPRQVTEEACIANDARTAASSTGSKHQNTSWDIKQNGGPLEGD
jgi:hypothetical protein